MFPYGGPIRLRAKIQLRLAAGYRRHPDVGDREPVNVRHYTPSFKFVKVQLSVPP